MAIPDLSTKTRYRYGEPYPSESAMQWCETATLAIWPELIEHRDSIHIMYGGANADYPLHRRSVNGIVNEIREHYNTGKRNFIFDGLSEAVIIPNLELLHSTVDSITDIIDDISIIYITGSHNAEEGYSEWCSIIDTKRKINVISAAYFHFGTVNTYSQHPCEYVPGHKNKKFLCFNKVERQHRIDILENVIRLGLLDQSYYSFSMSIGTQNFLLGPNTKLPHIKSIQSQLPLVLNRTTERDNPVDITDDDLNYFNNSYFSLVTETIFYNSLKMKPGHSYSHVTSVAPGVFPSEKIYKCLALAHPFILVGTPGFLSELHKRGFKTFSPFIDETYDTIEDDDLRMEHIVNEIDRLCKLSEAELVDFTYKVKDIVEHNALNFRNTKDFRVTKNIVELLK